MWTPILIVLSGPASYFFTWFVVTHWPGRKRKEQEEAARRRQKLAGVHQRGSRLMRPEELAKMIDQKRGK